MLAVFVANPTLFGGQYQLTTYPDRLNSRQALAATLNATPHFDTFHMAVIQPREGHKLNSFPSVGDTTRTALSINSQEKGSLGSV